MSFSFFLHRTESTATPRTSGARMCLVDSGTGQQLKRNHEIASRESDRSVCQPVRLFSRTFLSFPFPILNPCLLSLFLFFPSLSYVTRRPLSFLFRFYRSVVLDLPSYFLSRHVKLSFFSFDRSFSFSLTRINETLSLHFVHLCLMIVSSLL